MQQFLELDNLTAFGLVWLRMAGCITFNPILGRKNVPAMMQAGMSIALALLVYTYSDVATTVAVIDSTIELIIVGLKELFVGFAIGFVVSLFSYIIILGGEVMDMQMGLAMSKVYDPGSNESMSLSSTMYNVLFIFTFFIVEGHITLFKLFLDLEKVVPYGEVLFVNGDLAQHIIMVFCQCTILGLKLSMPMLALQFLMEIGVGVLMKNIPQINVLMINIQIKIFVGFIFMVVIFSPIMAFTEDIIELMFENIVKVCKLLG